MQKTSGGPRVTRSIFKLKEKEETATSYFRNLGKRSLDKETHKEATSSSSKPDKDRDMHGKNNKKRIEEKKKYMKAKKTLEDFLII